MSPTALDSELVPNQGRLTRAKGRNKLKFEWFHPLDSGRMTGNPEIIPSQKSPLEGVKVDQTSKKTAKKTDFSPKWEIGVLDPAHKPL